MKRLIGVFLCLPILAVPAFAEQYPFDRVFTTQQQRQIMDDLRKGETFDSEQPLHVEKKENNIAAERYLVSGIILRDDGKHMVWINGKSELSNAHRGSDLNISRPNPYSKRVRLSTEKNTQSAKPGQVWLVNSNRVKESYELTKSDSVVATHNANDASSTKPSNNHSPP